MPRVSVNVSARRLHDEELIAQPAAQLNIKPGTLSFELVESIFLDENDDIVTWNIDQIKELGIDIEIDDFGTGYASIVSLLKLKPRRLKIDRQLVHADRRLARPSGSSSARSSRSASRSASRSWPRASRPWSMRASCKSLGCDALQGYAFARAMSDEDFREFVTARKFRAAS